jgi:hypothetical protein
MGRSFEVGVVEEGVIEERVDRADGVGVVAAEVLAMSIGISDPPCA